MRRRKEELGERLKDCPHKRHRRSRSFWKSALRFAVPALQPGRVSGIALGFPIPPAGSTDLLLPPQVLEHEKDTGLGRPGSATRPRSGCGAVLAGARILVRSLVLMPEAELGAEAFEPLPCPTVHRSMPLGQPGVWTRRLMAANSTVRSAGLLVPTRAVPHAQRRVGLLTVPAVLDRSRIFGRMPHSRCGIDLESLEDRERLDYLREAEVLRGIPMDRGELLAVFKWVPVELVARVRYPAGHGLLLYTVARVPGLERTRLHDLAAVRDRDNGRVHLVAHRTRYRTVFLA